MNYFKYELWSNYKNDNQLRASKLQQTTGNNYDDYQTIAVTKSNQNHPPPSSTILNTINAASNVPKVSYVTSLWTKVKNAEIHPHKREVEAALLANIHNPHFDQVVVFLDRVDSAETCLRFQQETSEIYGEVFSMTADQSNEILSVKLKCVDVHTGQPTYYQMFQNALSDLVTGDVVVLANADMAFDDTISLARHLNPEVLAVLGTRGFSDRMPPVVKDIYGQMMGTDYMTNLEQLNGEWNTDMCRKTLFSWDTYIFLKSTLMGRLNSEDFKRLNTNNEMVPFYMNENGAESAALWAVQQSYPFTSIYNACDRIHSWHFHLTPKTHKDRETPWLQGSSDVHSPMFTPKGYVPKPWGGVQTRVPHPFAPKNPDCVHAGNCFLPLP
ncbi:hypothetical protein ACHAXM_004006 [Skeletonema potamos]